jgi:hypothetical protein
MKLKRCGWIGVVAAGWLGTAGAVSGATNDEVVLYGLTNRSIAGATVVADEETRMLNVGGLSDYGYKGVSVRLGEADSGLFFTPFTRASLENDYFMAGHAFGKVGGIHRRLSTVFCKRKDWAEYPITVDLLPLGSLRKTVFAYVGEQLIAQETYTEGVITVYSSNDSNLGPRANPFWRMPDGSVGVMIELSSTPPVRFPSGRSGYADRIFVRADNPLFDVEYVSRVDVVGGGGLPEFSALDERLGMFGRPHAALGAAVFTAKSGKLKLSGCNDAGTDGVLVELSNDAGFSARLQPVSMASTGSVFHVGATSSRDRYNYYSPAVILGFLGVENHDGEKRFRIDMSQLVEEVRVEAFDDGQPTGALITSSFGFGGLGTNEVRIVSAGVTGTSGTNTAALHLELEEPARLTLDAGSLRGNFFRVSLVNPTNDVATFSSFQILACGTAFTISGETVASPTDPVLTIADAGTNVVMTWPARYANYTSLQSIERLVEGGQWDYTSNYELRPASGSRVAATLPKGFINTRFFRLDNYYAYGFRD